LSTSDRHFARIGALIRLVHPFPSILDGLVVAGTALLAGGGAVNASRLGISMTALQFAIGALNDVVDAPVDAGHVPPKPIPSGLLTSREARAVAVGAAVVGVLTAAPSGIGTVARAAIVLAIGGAYDLIAKGTAWSWLPFAIGIPVLPVYGWFGATGTLPPAFAVLLPMAVLAGAALAIANARADLDTDLAAGTRSVATALGPRASMWANVALLAAATLIGLVAQPPTTWAPWVGFVILTSTAGALSLARSGGRQAWQLQAIGVALAGVGWVGALLA
jgi:4-hydroxybenzoate polyprenyltransferase